MAYPVVVINLSSANEFQKYNNVDNTIFYGT